MGEIMSSLIRYIEFQRQLSLYKVRKIAPKILKEFTDEEKKIISKFLNLTLKELNQFDQELLDNVIRGIKDDKY